MSILLMEFQFPDFPNFLAFVLMFIMAMKIAKRYKTNNPTPKLPPGPWKLPIIGNAHQLVGSLPHHCFRDLSKKYGALMHVKIGEISSIIVSSPEMAREITQKHDIIFSRRPQLLSCQIIFYDCTDMAFSPYGHYWRQLRKICRMELFSEKRVQSFRSVREEVVSDFIGTISLQTTTPINLSAELLFLACCIISRMAFGRRYCNDQQAFTSVVREITEAMGGLSFSDIFPSLRLLPLISGMKAKLQKLHLEVDRILENIINEHKGSETRTKTESGEAEEEDLVDVLLKLQDDGDLEIPLTHNNIKAIILDMFTGGTETSATTIEWAMSELLKNPTTMKRAQAEVRRVFDGQGYVDEAGTQKLEYLKSVIKETLRLHPPAPLIPRECAESCEIGGYDIPVNTRVFINAWAIARDPNYWTDADKFFPERFLNSSLDYKGKHFEYIPFGAGRRICPGLTFATPISELVLAQLLYHFDWELANGIKPGDLNMTEHFGLGVSRKTPLNVIPLAYHSLPIE